MSTERDAMSTEPQTPQEGAIVEVETSSELTSPPQPPANPVQQETQDLIRAIQTKAFSEAQKAGEFARESYLEAVRRARQEVENLDLFEPERIEEAIERIQGEVEKDWGRIASEVNRLGDRLNEAARAAWEALTKPSSDSDSDS